jgi:hypothetical protein
MLRAGVLLVAIAACTTPTLAPPRAAFSFDAMLGNAPAYVAERYESGELPSALIADLTADGFTCENSATMTQCSRTTPASPVCFDVAIVRISNAAPVYAEQNRRCLGARP